MKSIFARVATGRLVVCIFVVPLLAGCGGGGRMQSGLAAVTLTPNRLSFPDEAPGSASPAQSVTITNSGTAELAISGIAIGANFQEVDDCSSPVAVGAHCALNVTFVPTIIGNLQGTVTLTDNAPNSPHSLTLTGQGVSGGPPVATLTGYCFGLISGAINKCSLAKDLTSCPAGKVASQPQFVVGCLPPTSQYIDTSTSCKGKTGQGLTVKGSCVVANN
jgi:hypothetical protein